VLFELKEGRGSSILEGAILMDVVRYEVENDIGKIESMSVFEVAAVVGRVSSKYVILYICSYHLAQFLV